MALPVSTPLSDLSIPERRNAPSSTLRNYAGWLRELENAQWSEKLRYRSQSEASNPGNVETNSDEAHKTSKIVVAEEPDEPGRLIRGAKESLFLPSRALAMPIGVSVTKMGDSCPAGVAQTGLPTPLLTVETELAPDTPSRMGLLVNNGKGALWTAHATHMYINGNELQIWIRDQRLSQESGLRLLQALRREFSRAGLDLASLTLNGNKL